MCLPCAVGQMFGVTGSQLCPGPAAVWKGQEHTEPVVGLTFVLACLASQQFQQLLRVGLLWEFRDPGKWLWPASLEQLMGWATGPSGSDWATRNTYVTVSKGKFG